MSTVKTNLFAAAKKKEPASKKPSMPEIKVEELADDIAMFAEAKSQIDMFEAQKKMAEGIIKDKGREIFMQQYFAEKRNIGSFKLVAGGHSLTCSIKDQYLKLDEATAEKINETYPDTVETKTIYSFNPELLEKYIDQISEALMNADIPEDVKGALLEAKVDYTIKKGTIDKVLVHGEDKATDFFQTIQPIVSLR